MKQQNVELLKGFYQNLKDSSLEPDDPYYEPYLERQPRRDPVANLAMRISLAEAASVSLLSGQRGSGKSTGLLRLKRELEQQGCEVFLCDMRDYMNLTTPVEISDFFIAIMGGLSEAVAERYGQNFTHEDYWTRMSNFLTSEVTLDSAGIKAGIATIKTSLKDDPSFKQRLQIAMRGHVARLVKEAHQFGAEIVSFIREQHNDADKKVVLLLDSIEQIRGVGAEAEKVYASVENLFSAHASSLQLNLLHVIYTIPPYLTPLAPNVGINLGGSIVYTMPSIHIHHRDGKRDDEGVDILSHILARRCPDWERVFSKDQLRLRITLSTGGDLREFFRMIRLILMQAMISSDELPVSYELIDDVKNDLRREMLPIAEVDKVWLKKIAESKDAELEDVASLPQLARFFDANLVQNYRNGEDWYDVHPLIRDALY